jgi:hypothetical protein
MRATKRLIGVAKMRATCALGEGFLPSRLQPGWLSREATAWAHPAANCVRLGGRIL